MFTRHRHKPGIVYTREGISLYAFCNRSNILLIYLLLCEAYYKWWTLNLSERCVTYVADVLKESHIVVGYTVPTYNPYDVTYFKNIKTSKRGTTYFQEDNLTRTYLVMWFTCIQSAEHTLYYMLYKTTPGDRCCIHLSHLHTMYAYTRNPKITG